MKRVNVNLFPKDGYLFVESDGAKLKAENWPKLMQKVSAYRKRAGLAQGDVEAEVMAQACARNPSHCHEESDANARQLAIVSLKGRVLKYLSFLRGLMPGNRIPWVSAQDAANRANVCAGCGHNTPLPEGCSSCRAAVKAMHDEILGRGRKQDARLNGCAILGESLVASVYVDHDVVDSDALPAHCWKKETNTMMRAIHYAWAMVRLNWWRVRGYRTLVDPGTHIGRLNNCYACKFLTEGRECGVCGCPIDAKTPLASEACPKGFWLAVKARR